GAVSGGVDRVGGTVERTAGERAAGAEVVAVIRRRDRGAPAGDPGDVAVGRTDIGGDVCRVDRRVDVDRGGGAVPAETEVDRVEENLLLHEGEPPRLHAERPRLPCGRDRVARVVRKGGRERPV